MIYYVIRCINKNDTDYTGNTNTTNTKIQRR